VTFVEFVGAVRVCVDQLVSADLARAAEGPSFVWDGTVARWRLRHIWATMSISPDTARSHRHLLVLGRDADVSGPFGAQSTPITFAAESDGVESVAGTIAQHFAWPAP
jgi:hypothetical protein